MIGYTPLAISAGTVGVEAAQSALTLSDDANKFYALTNGYTVQLDPPDAVELTLSGKESFKGRRIAHKWAEADGGWACGDVVKHSHNKNKLLGDDPVNLVVLYDGEEFPADHALDVADYSTAPNAAEFAWCFLN